VHASFAPFGAHHEQQGLSTHLIGMWVAFVAAAALIAFFTGKISEALSLREREIRILQERIAKNDRLASLATLSAGAAHELGTPLATIAVVSKELEHYASRAAGGGAVAEDARLIRSEIERCRTILHQMSADGGEPVGEAAQRVTAREIVSQTLRQFPDLEGSRIVTEVASEILLKLPMQAIVKSLVALLRNALDAAPDQSEVTLRVLCSDDCVRFEVIDRGTGISPDVLKRISEPFFTTKPASKGMGLGTFLVRSLAERLGGDLSYESRVGHGTRAILSLPLGAVLEGANVSA